MTINMEKQKVSSSSEQEGVDRISNLPEPIRVHIISFLPMEDAFRTSILSREWRKICASLPNLKFDEPDFEQRTPNSRVFKDFVNQILSLRNESNIEKFSLVAHVDAFSVLNICAWISVVVHHNVQELRLKFTSKLQEKFPSCVFVCRTLRVLELNNITLKLPSVVELPMLRTLKLVFVTFQNDNLPNQLLSCCPLLEEFTMAACSWDEPVAVVNIYAPTLKSLFLSILHPTFAIKISAVNLHEIKYVGIPPDISSETLSSLCNVDLFMLPPTHNEVILDVDAHNMNKIVRGLSSVPKLMLYLSSIEYLARVQDLFSNPSASCVSMKHLKLAMYPSESHVRVVTFLLNCYPNLQSLSIYVKTDWLFPMSNMGQPSQSQHLSTEGILRHLKTVGIFRFEGSEVELDLVRFLLENATVMEKMTITYSPQIKKNLPRRTNICDKLSTFTKISPSAIIYFSE